MKISTKGLPYSEWVAMRNTGIGGSDASVVMGENRWKSAIELYGEKIGFPTDLEDNEAMRQGRDLEAYAADRWMQLTGKRARIDNFMYRDDAYPFMTANFDRLVTGENAGLECKTTTSFTYAEQLESGEIPREWYWQCMHYISVKGADRWYLAAVVLGKGFYTFTIERDENDIARLREQEADFWQRVEDKNPPQPDGSKSAGAAIRLIADESTEKPDVLNDEKVMAYVQRFVDLGSQIKELTDEQNQCKQHIQLAMGGSEKVTVGDKDVVWKTVTSKRLDSKKLASEHADIVQQYYYESKSSRFEIKPVKKTKKTA